MKMKTENRSEYRDLTSTTFRSLPNKVRPEPNGRPQSHQLPVLGAASGGNGAPVPSVGASAKPSRRDVPAGEFPCDYCSAKCCRYFALPFDRPTTWKEFDQMRWFLLHERAAVFVENGDWYVLVYNVCRHLQADNRCGIYETRPQICRDYSTRNCEYEDSWVYDHYWELPEQVEEYAEAVLGPRRGRPFRAPRPAGPSRSLDLHQNKPRVGDLSTRRTGATAIFEDQINRFRSTKG